MTEKTVAVQYVGPSLDIRIEGTDIVLVRPGVTAEDLIASGLDITAGHVFGDVAEVPADIAGHAPTEKDPDGAGLLAQTEVWKPATKKAAAAVKTEGN